MSSSGDVLAEHYGIVATTMFPEQLDELVYRFGDVVFKVFPEDRGGWARREAELLDTLSGGDGAYRVQQLIPTLDGALYATWGGCTGIATRWCEGAKKTYREITTPEWHALGSELAALHDRLDGYAGELPRISEFGFDLAAQRAAMANHPMRSVATIARYLDVRIELLERFGERATRKPPVAELPIHNDYNQYNYLFDGTLPPIILDWEGAGAAPREYEVVRCLNHLPLVAPAHATAFVDGYRSRRTLDRDGLRWAVDRSLFEHSIKSWPLERVVSAAPGVAEKMLEGTMEVLHALHDGVPAIERFFGVEGM